MVIVRVIVSAAGLPSSAAKVSTMSPAIAATPSRRSVWGELPETVAGRGVVNPAWAAVSDPPVSVAVTVTTAWALGSVAVMSRSRESPTVTVDE
jgi:hypothetical protein